MTTEPEEFRQRLLDIQNSVDVVYSTLPSDEPRFIIDTNSRTINIPIEFQFLGVRNDHNAETIYFEIDRYFDDEDLSHHTCVVQFANKNNSNYGGIYPVTTMDTTSVDGKIIFGWEIKNDATSIIGDIYFSVRFYSIDSTDYIFTYNFNTLTAKSSILDTHNIYNKTIIENYPSELDVWMGKMDELSRGTEGKVEEVQQVSAEAIAEINAVKESIPEDYNTLLDEVSELKGDITEIQSAQETTRDDAFYITDKDGNVIAKIDKDGIDSVGIKVNGEDVAAGNADIINEYQNALYVADKNGNVILKVDKNGLDAVGIGGKTDGPYTGKELISIGDSLSTGGKWQEWIAKWTGCNFDENINTNGNGEYPAMSIGGTAIMPEVETSIYMRSLHVQHYNPGIIVIYAGQNDGRYFYMGGNSVRDGIVGTIDDSPYKKTVVYTEVPESEWGDYTCQTGDGAVDGAPTVYAAAMGMIENIMETCPEAVIRCLTPMYMWCEVPNSSGYTTEQPPYRPILAKMWEEICDKYNIKLVNMWKDSGVNKYNASSYYNGVGNVHFNDHGYRRVAECIYNTL